MQVPACYSKIAGLSVEEGGGFFFSKHSFGAKIESLNQKIELRNLQPKHISDLVGVYKCKAVVYKVIAKLSPSPSSCFAGLR